MPDESVNQKKQEPSRICLDHNGQSALGDVIRQNRLQVEDEPESQKDSYNRKNQVKQKK